MRSLRSNTSHHIMDWVALEAVPKPEQFTSCHSTTSRQIRTGFKLIGFRNYFNTVHPFIQQRWGDNLVSQASIRYPCLWIKALLPLYSLQLAWNWSQLQELITSSLIYPFTLLRNTVQASDTNGYKYTSVSVWLTILNWIAHLLSNNLPQCWYCLVENKVFRKLKTFLMELFIVLIWK